MTHLAVARYPAGKQGVLVRCGRHLQDRLGVRTRVASNIACDAAQTIRLGAPSKLGTAHGTPHAILPGDAYATNRGRYSGRDGFFFLARSGYIRPLVGLKQFVGGGPRQLHQDWPVPPVDTDLRPIIH